MSSNESTQTIPRVSINIHSSTTFHGFKRCEQAKRCRRKTKNNGRHLSPFQDCDDKIHILKILTKNDKNCVHLYPSIKSKKKCRKRRDKKISRPTFRVSIPILRINEEGKFESDCEEDLEDLEEIRKSIEEKISKGKYMFSKPEEKDIHKRAEDYCRTVAADIYHYVKPGETESHLKYPSFLANKDCFHLKYLPSYKRQSYETRNCYVKSHDDMDPYDNTKLLPIGTKLLRPSGKVVELVAKVLQESPNGLLQVPQIYAALQNKYPYFRYMEKSAISSWRSSVRHALYQKWFKKVKFFVADIQCKGSYWALNTEPDPPKRKKLAKNKTDSTQATEGTEFIEEADEKSTKKKRSRKRKKECHLQFRSNGELVEIKENQKDVRNHNVTNSLQDLLNIAKQYGLTVSLATTPIPMKTEVEDGSIFPGDPVLSSLPIAHLNPEANEPTLPISDWNVMNSSFISGTVNTRGSERNLVSHPLLPSISRYSRSADSSSEERVPGTTFNRIKQTVHSLEKNTKSYSHEMLCNVQSIFTDSDSEILYVNKDSADSDSEERFLSRDSEILYVNKDSAESYCQERFLSRDSEEMTENIESEELSAVNSICHKSDEYDNCCMLYEEEGNHLVGVKSLSNYCNVHHASEPGRFYSVPSPISDDSNSCNLGDSEFLDRILRIGGNPAEELMRDDYLIDTTLINEDSFFQQCKFFDNMDE